MGVEFFDCELCNTSICDCGDYFTCKKCKYSVCTDCAWDEKTEEDVCPFCTLKEIHIDDLLKYALKKLKVSRKKLEENYRRDNL